MEPTTPGTIAARLTAVRRQQLRDERELLQLEAEDRDERIAWSGGSFR